MARFDMEIGALDTVASYDYMPRIPPGLEWNPIDAVGEVMVATGQFVYTRSDRPEVTWRLPDGTVTQIVRWQAEPAQLTEELVEPVERMRNRVAYFEAPDSRIEDIIQEGASPYTVIPPDGEWLGTVEAPPGLRILDVTGGLVLGVERDNLDVERVVVYELVGE